MSEGDYRNYLFVSKSLLDFIKVYYFKYVYEIKIPKANLCSLFSEIFITLSNITLEDELSIKEAFIPFLFSINESARLDEFFKRIYLSTKHMKKNEIFIRLINCKLILFLKKYSYNLNEKFKI